jgi:hypothetical protein
MPPKELHQRTGHLQVIYLKFLIDLIFIKFKGITVTSSLISLALGIPTKQNIAMTGEVSLRG